MTVRRLLVVAALAVGLVAMHGITLPPSGVAAAHQTATVAHAWLPDALPAYDATPPDALPAYDATPPDALPAYDATGSHDGSSHAGMLGLCLAVLAGGLLLAAALLLRGGDVRGQGGATRTVLERWVRRRAPPPPSLAMLGVLRI